MINEKISIAICITDFQIKYIKDYLCTQKEPALLVTSSKGSSSIQLFKINEGTIESVYNEELKGGKLRRASLRNCIKKIEQICDLQEYKTVEFFIPHFHSIFIQYMISSAEHHNKLISAYYEGTAAYTKAVIAVNRLRLFLTSIKYSLGLRQLIFLSKNIYYHPRFRLDSFVAPDVSKIYHKCLKCIQFEMILDFKGNVQEKTLALGTYISNDKKKTSSINKSIINEAVKLGLPVYFKNHPNAPIYLEDPRVNICFAQQTAETLIAELMPRNIVSGPSSTLINIEKFIPDGISLICVQNRDGNLDIARLLERKSCLKMIYTDEGSELLE